MYLCNVLRNLFPKQEDENKNFKVIEHEKDELCNTFDQIDENYQTVDCKRIGIIKKENEARVGSIIVTPSSA